MESNDLPPGTCFFCKRGFTSIKLLHMHIRRMHKQVELVNTKVGHLICPLCGTKKDIDTFLNLETHLSEIHQIVIEKLHFSFSSIQEFDDWKQLQKIKAMYAIGRTIHHRTYKQVWYYCNRSNVRGYKSICTKISPKAGGSIKISGVCPSRLLCDINNGENVNVIFWKTHVGHDIKLRTKQLSANNVRIRKVNRAKRLKKKKVKKLKQKVKVKKLKHEVKEKLEKEVEKSEHEAEVDKSGQDNSKDGLQILEEKESKDTNILQKEYFCNLIDNRKDKIFEAFGDEEIKIEYIFE